MYTCKIFKLAESKPCEMISRNLKYALESSNLNKVVSIEEIELDDSIVITEGMTRVPVLELWADEKMIHYHVGMLTQAEVTEILLEKIHRGN